MKIHEVSNIYRYTGFNFPIYRYVPKQTPVPANNHIPELPGSVSEFDDQNWQDSEIYLYAIDLFNYQYYWEVHEVLEKIWLKSGKKSPEGIFIQGLIQLSVALLKKTQNQQAGVKRLMEKALPKLHTQKALYLGIDVEKLIGEALSFTENNQVNYPLIALKFKY